MVSSRSLHQDDSYPIIMRICVSFVRFPYSPSLNHSVLYLLQDYKPPPRQERQLLPKPVRSPECYCSLSLSLSVSLILSRHTPKPWLAKSFGLLSRVQGSQCHLGDESRRVASSAQRRRSCFSQKVVPFRGFFVGVSPLNRSYM